MEAARFEYEGRAVYKSPGGAADSTMDDMQKRAARAGHAASKAALAKAKRLTIGPDFKHLMKWYDELRGANPHGMHFEPITHSEILAYKTLHDLPMDSFDVEMLRRLDVVWMNAQPKPEKPKGRT